MKKENTKVKRLFTIMIIITSLFLSIKGVKAEEYIELGRGTQIHNSYVGGVNFAYKVTTTGEYLYCVDISKKTASNVRADRLLNSKIMNGGVVHILKNGYPYKNITGDKDKDYYITQTALWWYLDETTGSMNLGEYFKEKGPDRYNMRSKIKNLVNEGLAHKNDPIGEIINDVEINVKDNSMQLKNGYYTSNEIKLLNYNSVEKVTVTLNNQPEGTMITKNGVDTVYTGPFTIDKTDSFQVKVKRENIKELETNIDVQVETEELGGYTAFEYVPKDSSMQHVTKLERINLNSKNSITLNITTSKVSITKIDTNTKQPIQGAKLAIFDEKGNEVTTWISTTSAHIIYDLENGVYTLKEVEAPKGYLLNKNDATFTITDNKKDIVIKFENAPKKVVVNITKIAQETSSPLAGAVIVVKKQNGEVVARFTTTTSSYTLTDLEDGVYTVEEETAPDGYIKSNEKATFTIDDNHPSHQITLVNLKEVKVPDTLSESTTSILMVVLGISILGCGVEYIYKKKKHAK